MRSPLLPWLLALSLLFSQQAALAHGYVHCAPPTLDDTSLAQSDGEQAPETCAACVGAAQLAFAALDTTHALPAAAQAAAPPPACAIPGAGRRTAPAYQPRAPPSR